MRAKTYTVRSLTLGHGKDSLVQLNLEFEGERAFVIWDSIPVGNYQLKARLEIDPHLLQKSESPGSDFLYCGELVLPKPENN